MKQAEKEILIPGQTVSLIGFSTVFVTSAKVGTRFVVMEWKEWALGAIAQEPNETVLYNWGVGLQDDNNLIYYNFSTKTSSKMITRALPDGLTMSPGEEIGLSFHNLDVEGLDKWNDQLIGYESWL